MQHILCLNILNRYKLTEIYSPIPNGIHASSGVNGNNLSLGMQKVTMLTRGL